MPVHIEEVVSTVHTVDDAALLSPEILRQIVDAVMREVRAEEAHRNRVNSEQAINAGLAQYEYRR